MLELKGTMKDVLTQLKVCHVDKSDQLVVYVYHQDEMQKAKKGKRQL